MTRERWYLRSWHQWQGPGIRNVLKSRRARLRTFLDKNETSSCRDCATKLCSNWTMDQVLIARDFESNLIVISEEHGIRNADALMVRLIQYVARTSPLWGELVCTRNSFARLALTNALGAVRRGVGHKFWDALKAEEIIVNRQPATPDWLSKLLVCPCGCTGTRTDTHTGTRPDTVPVPHARALSESGSGSGNPEPPLPRSAGGAGLASLDPEGEALKGKRDVVLTWASRRMEKATGPHRTRAEGTLRANREGRMNIDREYRWIERNDPDMLRKVQSSIRRAARASQNGDHA